MSFILEYKIREHVAFHIPTETQIDYDPPTGVNELNISTNMWMSDPGGQFVMRDCNHGNFSKWLNVPAGNAVVVSGLTSCGAVFVANHNFSRIAAGHMSGDAQFVKDWCDKIAADGQNIAPFYMVFGSGTSGSSGFAGRVLLDYMNEWKIPPSRAPAVKGCGAMMVRRAKAGAGHLATVYAQRQCTM